MPSKLVKLVVFVPERDADKVRNALGVAGAGTVGNYLFCTFSTKGIGRFRPGEGASPHIGKVGELEAVHEERIETVCRREILSPVVSAMKAAHPYEEVPYEVYALEDIE